MRLFIKPTQDTSIYERYPTLNTGLDEQLEVGKLIKSTDLGSMYASGSVRSLLNFDISSGSYPTNAKYFLNLNLANAKYISRYQILEVCPISQSWVEGSGYFYQDVKNAEDGATWTLATRHTSWSNAGGDFTTDITASYIFNDVLLDSNIRIDVTNIISPVILGTNITPWNGLLVKFPDGDELDQTNSGNLKIFSSNTHTVFDASLEVVWDEQQFVTGSLKPIPNGNVTIIPKNLKEAYTRGEIDKIYLVVRDPYPDKRFDSMQRYRTTYYLPSESYFRIRDQVSGVEIHKFDAYSAINCDNSGSYITLDTSGLNINRYYDIDLKIKKETLVFFPEFKYTFTVDTND